MRIVNQNQYITKSLKTLLLLFLLIFQPTFAQQNGANDSLSSNDNTLKVKQFVIPATFVATGFVLLYNKKVNENIKNRIQKNNTNFKTSIDNYSQFAPGAAVFALNSFGVKGKHDYKDAALIYAGSIALASVFVLPLKAITKEERPDFSANNSFPSGHTAIAFASAEFLRQEYVDTPWIGYVGYAVATATGVLRMYNNRHWFGDVVAGAGFGIASAKLSYFLYDNVFLKNSWNFTLAPTYNNKTAGFVYAYNF